MRLPLFVSVSASVSGWLEHDKKKSYFFSSSECLSLQPIRTAVAASRVLAFVSLAYDSPTKTVVCFASFFPNFAELGGYAMNHLNLVIIGGSMESQSP